MHGRRLDALVAQYLQLRDGEGLDLLCLQEDRYIGDGPDERPSVQVAQALGDSYRVVRDEGCQGLAFGVDARTLSTVRGGIIPLPRLASRSASWGSTSRSATTWSAPISPPWRADRWSRPAPITTWSGPAFVVAKKAMSTAETSKGPPLFGLPFGGVAFGALWIVGAFA